MSNVLINKQKIDILANAISAKSGEPLTMTLDEMVEAVDGIETGRSAEPVLQDKSVTPTESAQTVTADSGYDGLGEVSVGAISSTYVGSEVPVLTEADVDAEDPDVMGITASQYPAVLNSAIYKYIPYADHSVTASINSSTGLITATSVLAEDSDMPNEYMYTAKRGTITDTLQLPTQSATTITPTTSSQTAVTAGKYTTGAVTVSAMPSGTAGTPIATKGTVSNHSVSVTPSVTNTTGYITGSTKTGTSVSVSASELVSGSLNITSNGTHDVTNYASAIVDVSGGGASEVGTASVSNSSATATSINFTGLIGQPIAFFVRTTTTITSSGNTSYYYVASIRYNGTNTQGTYMRVGSTRGIYNDTSHYSYSYNNGTLTVSSSASRSAAGGSFYNGTYELTYIY